MLDFYEKSYFTFIQILIDIEASLRLCRPAPSFGRRRLAEGDALSRLGGI
jgi:hypothetical protein